MLLAPDSIPGAVSLYRSGYHPRPTHDILVTKRARGRGAGFASWWSAVRVWRVGRSGESMLLAIHKVVNPRADKHIVGPQRVDNTLIGNTQSGCNSGWL